jgi:hypothetical protein
MELGNGSVRMFVVRISVLEIPLRINILECEFYI